MSAHLAHPPPMSVDEFLVWEEPGDGLTYQLVDGEPVAMAPASEPHGSIQAELGRLIGNHLLDSGRPCRVVSAPGMQPRVRSRGNVRIPDLAVTCAPPVVGLQIIEAPIVAIEILSPNNERETWANVWTFTTIPSLREILCVRLARIGCELLRRRPDGSWPDDPEPITQGMLTLESIGFACDVAAPYRTTHLAAKS